MRETITASNQAWASDHERRSFCYDSGIDDGHGAGKAGGAPQPAKPAAPLSLSATPPAITTLSGMNLDLTDPEADALAKLLTHTIDGDRYFLSSRVQTLRAILSKLRPEPPREPLPPLKTYAPPARGRYGRRG